jgi:hypothetical protein
MGGRSRLCVDVSLIFEHLSSAMPGNPNPLPINDEGQTSTKGALGDPPPSIPPGQHDRLQEKLAAGISNHPYVRRAYDYVVTLTN